MNMKAARPARDLVGADDKAIMKLWRLLFDTQEIATKLNLEEHQVERRLHQLKDAERAAKTAG